MVAHSKKCIYCKTEIPHDSVIDFCRRCGVGVWGEKMFNAIEQQMKEANDRGDLNFNSQINQNFKEDPEKIGVI